MASLERGVYTSWSDSDVTLWQGVTVTSLEGVE